MINKLRGDREMSQLDFLIIDASEVWEIVEVGTRFSELMILNDENLMAIQNEDSAGVPVSAWSPSGTYPPSETRIVRREGPPIVLLSSSCNETLVES